MEHESCRQLLGSLSEYIDGSLETELCAKIEQHLSDCENCRIVVDSLNKTISLYHTSAQNSTVPEGVRERLLRCLDLSEYL